MPSSYYLQNKATYWINLKLAAQEIGIPYMWLHAIIWIETNRSLDPLKHNGIGYRGLCQWGMAASNDLGYGSSLELVTKNNTYEKQFKIVVQWYKLNISRHGNQYHEVAFYYCLNFMPAKVSAWGNNSNKIASATQNPFLDFDSNGTITVGDLKNRLAETQKEVAEMDISPAPALIINPNNAPTIAQKKITPTQIVIGVSLVLVLVGGVILVSRN